MRPAPAARQVVYESQPSASASFFMTLFFLILAAGAFYLGMSIRHQKETGRSLLRDIQGSAAGLPPGAVPEAAPAPAAE